MKQKHFQDALLFDDRTIFDAMQIIDRASLQIAMVTDKAGRLVGTVTDGDIRRAILSGLKLEDNVQKIMNSKPFTMRENDNTAETLRIMGERQIHQVPVLNESGQVIRLENLESLLKLSGGHVAHSISGQGHDHWVVLMLGGMGTRLMPLTQNTPKPMLPVGNKPLLQIIIENFKRQGFYKFYFSVNYKAEIIESHFGDGQDFGVEILYLRENERLGTGGALGLLRDHPKNPFLVMNGDLLTAVNFRNMIDFHAQNKVQVTMGVREYHFELPYGVIQNAGIMLENIVEKPKQTVFVNAGIYVLEPAVLEHVQKAQYLDMPDLIERLKGRGFNTAVFPIREYWRDIGRAEDLEQARIEYEREFGT